MLKIARFVATIALVSALHCPAARASTDSSDITDMWWNPAESGWGVNVVLQNNVAFMTFFIYDQALNPVWYTAQLTNSGSLVWSGPLYVTHGPWFGGGFPPSTVTIRQAGTARFALTDLATASFTYSVDGVLVSKTMQRQTWTNENYTGNYASGYSIRATGCNPSSFNGLTEVSGLLNVSQSRTAVTMVSTSNIGTCTFAGAYSQFGKLGQIQGSYNCGTGEIGSFLMFELTPTISGFTGRVQGSNQYCQWSGDVGGISRAP